ncbi:MAG: ABC transporter permease [Vicinamibacterales bacterium]|nr:ABC transporter permease [Vicinamibacterales bacterium]
MILQDLRYAARGLWHARGFATVAILCLGLGIGLNTTIFSVVDGVLLQPYPYRDPDRLLVLGVRNQDGDQQALSLPELRDWKDQTATFETIAGAQGRAMAISDAGGEPERYLGALISWDLFPMLGTDPILGRTFTRDEDQPNAAGVVLLSHMLWTTRYQQDAAILGRSILIDGRPHTVVGVMPPDFAFPFNQRLWVPVEAHVANPSRSARSLFTLGRLRPGVSPTQGAEELGAIAARLANDYPATNTGWTAHVETLRQAFLPPEVPLVLYLMMAGVTFVLLIACSNVANLLLARATTRSREFAIRLAIGAGRGRIIRQLLAEGVVLALASVPLGVLIAQAGTRALASMMPADGVPYYVRWELDARSLAYTLAITLATAAVFALFPAVQVTGRNLYSHLKEGGRGNTGARSFLRNALVVAQVSLAVVALVGAMLFVRTFRNLDSYAIGFDTRPFLTLRFYMTGETYTPEGARLRRAEDVVRRVEALPGVEAAFASNLIPLDGGGGGGQAEIEGRPAEEGQRMGITFTGVTPAFHRALGISVIRGRDFTEAEGWSRAPVAVINQTMANRFWTNADPLEQRFRLQTPDRDGEWFRVIGVVPDVQLYGIDPSATQAPASAFVPYGYQESLSTGLTIRVAGDPASYTGAVRGAIRASDPHVPLFFIRTLEEVRRTSFWQFGLFGWVFGAIGLVGLVLAAVGVYGVLAYAVSQRTQEIGVRVALGADRRAVLTLIVGQGLRLAGVGVVIGLIMAAAAMPLARSVLYNVSPFDPLSFAAVAVFLLAVAVLASYVPALRATRVDPLEALREG